MKTYALLGEKLGHSHSPLIHNEIFKAFNIECKYVKLECKKEELKDIINSLRIGTYHGFNVTIPYKKEELLPISYKGNLLSKQYYADFVCYDCIIVELKAVTS